MATVTVGKENPTPVNLYHEDHGVGSPRDATFRRQAKLVENAKFVELAGGPHGVLRTHADQINSELARLLS